MGSERPRPRRGDWIEAKGASSRIVLKFYSAPPKRGIEIEAHTYVNPYQYLGPVHDVEDSAEFVSVRLPHPTTGKLVWTNICSWSCTKARGGDYAFVVADERLAAWLREGFRNEFLD